MKDDTAKAAEFIEETCERQGYATSTMKDGTLLYFKRTFLQAILDKHPDNEKLIIFLKKPDTN